MKCPKCKRDIGDSVFCEFCNIDIIMYDKIIQTSRRMYNKALSKAHDRDLTGAVDLLIKSLKFNKKNIEARNLLGLVYYKIGEIGEALKQWVISTNYFNDEKNNLAYNYIKMIQNNGRKLEHFNATIKMYNEALNHVKQRSEDLAIIKLKKAVHINPDFIKAQNLLAYCYIKENTNDKALQCINTIFTVDARNPIALEYKEILESNLIQDYDVNSLDKNIKPNTEIKSLGSSLYRNAKQGKNMFASISQIVLFVIGIICGVAVVFTLYIPDRLNNLKYENDKIKKTYIKTIDNNKKDIADKDKMINDLNTAKKDMEKELEDYKYKAEKLDIAKSDSDSIIKATEFYLDGDIVGCATELLNVSQSNLSSKSNEMYIKLKNTTFSKASVYYYNKGVALYTPAYKQNDKNKFEEAKKYFELSLRLSENESISDDSMYFLARCYQQLGKKQQAKKTFEDFFEKYSNKTTKYRYNSAKNFYSQL